MEISEFKNWAWVIGIVFSAGMTWQIVRVTLKGNSKRLDTHDKRIESLEQKSVGQLTKSELDNRFITRREFDLHMKNVQLEIKHVSKDTTDIKEQSKLILAAVTGKKG